MIDSTGICRLGRFRNSMFVLAEELEIIRMFLFQKLRGTQKRHHVKIVSILSYLFRS